MIDYKRTCEHCGTVTATYRIAIGMAVDAVNLCLQCLREGVEELEEAGVTVAHGDIGGES